MRKIKMIKCTTYGDIQPRTFYFNPEYLMNIVQCEGYTYLIFRGRYQAWKVVEKAEDIIKKIEE